MAFGAALHDGFRRDRLGDGVADSSSRCWSGIVNDALTWNPGPAIDNDIISLNVEQAYNVVPAAGNHGQIVGDIRLFNGDWDKCNFRHVSDDFDDPRTVVAGAAIHSGGNGSGVYPGVPGDGDRIAATAANNSE